MYTLPNFCFKNNSMHFIETIYTLKITHTHTQTKKNDIVSNIAACCEFILILVVFVLGTIKPPSFDF